MLGPALFILLVGVNVCRGAQGATYSAFYDADGVNENADFYDSYNDEIKAPPGMSTVAEAVTRHKRRGMEEIRTLNPKEIIDVKGVLKNILQGKNPEPVREHRAVKEYTDTYDYLVNSKRPDDVTEMGRTQKWLHTYKSQNLQNKQENMVENTDQSITEQHWSFVYQPESSTYSDSDIIAEVGKNKLESQKGTVPKRSSIDLQYWRPTLEVQTWITADGTGDSEITVMYPQETSTFSNLDMLAADRKVVQHWSPDSKKNMLPQESATYGSSEKQAGGRKFVQHWSPNSKEHIFPQETATYNSSIMQAEVRKLVQHWSPSSKETRYRQETAMYNNSVMQAEVRKLVQHWSPSSKENMLPQETAKYNNSVMQAEVRKLVQHWSPSSKENKEVTPSYNDTAMRAEVRQLIQHWSPNISVHPSPTRKVKHWSLSTEKSLNVSRTSMGIVYSLPVGRQQADTTTDIETTTWTTFTTTTPRPTTTITTTPQIDIDAIMAIISNLTYDYEWNLTEQFNKSIIQHGIPTCPNMKWGPGGSWTTTDHTPTTGLPYDFENASVVTKCFVCGLHTPEIPRNAYCADAFAGDFLPLMPIDARSRGKIASFRKYCRYMDVQNFVENPDEPRAIYGRFSGGCAVRWTDLTGVYTQRTCRSKYRPLMGKHFASKRMAKLELALVNVENGCIISPMATLLPVSRGISLYARFHACVCSTNWCNRATLAQTSIDTVITVVLAYWLAHT